MKPFPSRLPPVPDAVRSEDLELARRHAPVVQFDKLEPFLPVAVGYTVFRSSAPSLSFKREIELPESCACAIEYAVWWDWDIQHLYELEHLWVYLDEEGSLIAAEGSAHGDFHPLQTEEGNLPVPVHQGRLHVHSEPGKHAFAGSPEQLRRLSSYTLKACGSEAGQGDVLINDMFRGKISASKSARRLCERYMKAHAFTPTYDFALRSDLRETPLVSWHSLEAWIPDRVNAWLEQLVANLPQIAAVLLDCGDTLVDEGSEVKNAEGTVTAAELIPGAKALLEALTAQGYRLALVADGQVQSFANIFAQHGLEPYFETKAISEVVGADKPDALMFETALASLDLSPESYPRVVMVGNHLGRDVKGANALGLTSVWLDWAPRRAKVPASALEIPDFTLHDPLELLKTLDALETGWVNHALEADKAATLELKERHG